MNMDVNTELNKIEDLRNAYFVINTMYIITIVIGFFGNILIVTTILKNKYLRTPMNVSLVSLALCDIVVCVFVLPVRLFLYSGTWSAPYTFVLCRVDVFLKSVCDYVQTSMLVATSYERYKSIAKPFQSKTKMKRTVILIVITWGTCILSGIISALLLKDGATIFPCNKDIFTTAYLSASLVNYREAYVTFPLGFLCIVVVCVFYYLMIRTLHEHTNKMKNQYKSKPFKNKIHPDSKIDTTVTKELNLDALTIQPLVIVNNDVDVAKNSRQTSGASLMPSESVNNRIKIANSNIDLKKDDQFLCNKDQIGRDSGKVIMESNLECQEVEDVSPDVTIRRISIKKTRDNILLPSNERSNMRRFSTVAKHVFLLKSHKKRSLHSMQSRKNNSTQNVFRKTSAASHECKTSDLKSDDNEDGSKMPTEKGKKESVNMTQSDFENMQEETNKSKREADTISVINANCFVAESGKQRLIEGQTDTQSVLTDDDADCVSNKTTIFVESSNDDGSVNASSEQTLKDNDITDNNRPSVNLDTCTISKTDEDNNEKCPLNDGGGETVKENKSELSSKLNIADSKDKQNDNTESTKDKIKVSNIDIVDFDGTVHKDVKVEGAVVGAVCVMNKTNRLEGRRKVEMRAAKRIAVLMGSFVLLWLPLPLIALFVSRRRQISTSDMEALITSASISATTIAFNPILNLLLNKQLRSAALTLLRRVVNTLKSIRL